MAIIYVKPERPRRLAFIKDGAKIGVIEYRGILRRSGTIITGNNLIYELKRSSFFGRKFQLKQGEEIFAESRTGFMGSIAISLFKTGKDFRIKRKSFPFRIFELTDNEDNTVGIISYKFSLFRYRREIIIETTDLFDTIKDNLFLCFISVFTILERLKERRHIH